MAWYDYGSYIVPIEETAPVRLPAQDYSQPWYVDTINRAIERAAQVATVQSAGYPPYPQFPAPSPAPMPLPYPALPGVQQQPREGIQLSQTTLMLLVGGVLLFMLGGRRK